MKKLLALALAAALALSLAACGGSGGPTLDYDEEFNGIMDRISELQKKADYVSSINTYIWQEVGPNKVADTLSNIRDLHSAMDMLESDTDVFRNVSQALDINGSDALAEAWTYIQKYNGDYDALSNDMETLKNDLKSLKDACGKEHSDGVDALQQYYIKLQAYSDFAIAPSGNLTNYHSNHQQFENDMAELRSAAEFDK